MSCLDRVAKLEMRSNLSAIKIFGSDYSFLHFNQAKIGEQGA
jgi:hypothetical protein